MTALATESSLELLARSGRILAVRPGPDHLIELRRLLYADLRPQGGGGRAAATTVAGALQRSRTKSGEVLAS